MRPTLVCSMMTIGIICITNSYYLSPNMLNWGQANYFCINHCNSTLASIHNQSQFDEAVKLIYDDMPNMKQRNLLQTYIGLINDGNDGTFRWIDGTTFDFGNYDFTVSKGEFPWRENEPDRNLYGSEEDYVIFMKDAPTWEAKSGWLRARVLCNHCDGVLNKYISVETIVTNVSDIIGTCQDLHHPTKVASFHNERDFEELKTLCQAENKAEPDLADCWIGLYTNDNWDGVMQKFYDGTHAYLNGISYSGFNQTSAKENGNNAYLDHLDSYLLRTMGVIGYDTSRTIVLCNMPSQLCYTDGSTMEVDTTDSNTIFYSGCVHRTNSSNEWQKSFHDSTVFYNGNGILVFELRWSFIIDSMSLLGVDSSFGIEIKSTCSNELYHVRMYRDGSDQVHLQLVYVNETEHVLESSQILLMDNIDTSADHSLLVSMERMVNSLRFHIDLYVSLKTYTIGNVSINTVHNPSNEYAYGINKKGYSGYISIYTRRSSILFRSLYISGTIHKDFDTNLCTLQPTINPTETPSVPEDSQSTPIYIIDITIIIKLVPNASISSSITDQAIDVVAVTANDILTVQDTNCLSEDSITSEIHSTLNATQVILVSINICNEETYEELLNTFNEELEGDLLGLEAEAEVKILNVTITMRCERCDAIEDVRSESDVDNIGWIVAGCIGGLLCLILLFIIAYRKGITKEIAEATTNEESGVTLDTTLKMNKVDSLSRDEAKEEVLKNVTLNCATYDTNDIVPDCDKQLSNESLWNYDGQLIENETRPNLLTPKTPKSPQTPQTPESFRAVMDTRSERSSIVTAGSSDAGDV